MPPAPDATAQLQYGTPSLTISPGERSAIFAPALIDQYVPTDERMTLLGKLEDVAGQANDLRRPMVLGEVIPNLFQGHGDLYR